MRLDINMRRGMIHRNHYEYMIDKKNKCLFLY